MSKLIIICDQKALWCLLFHFIFISHMGPIESLRW